MSDQQLPERSQIVQRHLAAAGIESAIRELPDSTRTAAEAAAALGCAVGAIASSLLFIADDHPLLVMTSGRHRVDVDVLKGAVRAEHLEMATAQQVRQATGQAIGGVAPTGHPAPIRTVVDAALDEHDVIWTAGGTPRTVVPLTVEELLRLTGGVRITVATDDP